MPFDAACTQEEGFTSARTARVMAEACRLAGLDAEGATLIRLGENALYRLASVPVVVRIARSSEYMASARNEVAVSRWLEAEQFPAARVLGDLEQPQMVDGHPVTFWHLIREGDRKATYAELGGVLRDLHSLLLPSGLELPPYNIFGRTPLRLARAHGIAAADREFLQHRFGELRTKVAELYFDSPKGPMHGDAHVQNLMVDDRGQVRLIDFEKFGFDHPEWDLMVTSVEHHSLGWQTAEEYAGFVSAYGRDLRDWPGFPTLRAVQEFHMTTWLMQNINEDRHVADEYARRIASLRDDKARRDWRPW
ncbi:phosphotransferase enzyme family protein [Streptoverticillium reticulum]|uniref:phosphotransferase enzyme family protein n=1 Tax=Streptoverticillium reticulum TaxID=1433415 RepID=UPI0039BF8FEE